VAILQVITSDRGRAKALTETLEGMGHRVQAGPMNEPLRQQLLKHPPQVIIIDLEQAPATGRDLDLFLRVQTVTRRILLIYLGGEAARVKEIKLLLPDAIFTHDDDLIHDLELVLVKPPRDPVVPNSVFAGYSGRPLPAKLGIKPDMRVSLIDAPPDFEKTLTPLPAGVKLDHYGLRTPQLTIWFVTSQSKLKRDLQSNLRRCNGGKLWIVWPKKGSKIPGDLTQNIVRQAGLETGWVDFKVCAVDATWSGLCFTLRKKG